MRNNNNIWQISLAFIFLAFCQSCSRERELKVHDADGVLRYEWLFKKDTLTGKKISYWPNGQVKEIHNFENGMLNGEYLGYYENGHIARQSKFYNNIIRGSALKFFEHTDGLIEMETYYLDVMGKQYMYFQKDFDTAGRIIKERRTLSFDFDCGSSRKVAKVNFVDNFLYDSVYLIVGRFSVDFSPDKTAPVDTTRATRLPMKIFIDKNTMSNDHVVRGKCIFFNGTIQGDSIRIDVKTRYFEETPVESCWTN